MTESNRADPAARAWALVVLHRQLRQIEFSQRMPTRIFHAGNHNLQIGEALLKPECRQFFGLGEYFRLLFGQVLRRFLAR